MKLQPKRLDNTFVHVELHYSVDPRRDAAWVQREAPRYGGTNAWKWRKEQEIDYQVAAGQRIWPVLDEGVHLQAWLPADYLGPSYARYRVLDHGIAHPCCCAFVAVNAEGTLYVWDEYYKSNAVIAENCRNILDRHREVVFAGNAIDPSTRQRLPNKRTTIIDEYAKHGLACMPADNSLVGYDAVAAGLLSTLARWSIQADEVHSKLVAQGISRNALFDLAKAPAIVFHPRCVRIFKEMQHLRYKDPRGDPTQRAAPEKPVDVADEGPDVVRYARQTVSIKYRRPRPKKPDIFEIIRAQKRKKRHLTRV